MQGFSRKSLTKVLLAAVVLVLTVALLGCAKEAKKAESSKVNESAAKTGKEVSYEKTELKYQGFAGIVLYPELAEDLGYLKPLKLNWAGNVLGGPESIQAAATGNTDFGFAATGAIINLLNAGSPIKYVLTWGGLDKKANNNVFVLNDSPIKNGRDLIGKKIAVNTLGAHYEFVIHEYLRREGLSPEEIKQVELLVMPLISTEQSLRQKQVDAAALGSIFQDKALGTGGIRSLINDYKLFGGVSVSGIILTDKFIKENPNTSRKFVEATAKAIDWANNTPKAEVIARFEKIFKERGRNEDPTGLKAWKSTGIESKGGLVVEKDIQLWIDTLVREGRLKKGQIKAADAYTNEFNPYKEKAEK